jgi:general secretion pathway protein E
VQAILDLAPREGTALPALLGEALAAPGGGLLLFAGAEEAGCGETICAAAAIAGDALVLPPIRTREEAAHAAVAVEAGRILLAAADAPTALGAIMALKAAGLEPPRIAAVLRAAFAQRRAARLCPQCRVPVQAPGGIAARLGFDAGTIVWEAAGCAACGEAGEVTLFEAIGVDSALRPLIACGGDAAVIAGHAFRDRADLGGAARALVRSGTIAVEEALRLAQSQ